MAKLKAEEKARAKKESLAAPEQGVSDNDEDEENEGPEKALVHESLKEGGSKGPKVRPPKTKYVPEGETKEQRDARTVFIGNLPVEAAKSKVRILLDAYWVATNLTVLCLVGPQRSYSTYHSQCARLQN